MVNKRQKGIAVVLVVFIILVSIAVAKNYRASANVGLMSNVEQFSIVNIRFISGNNVNADQIKVTLQNAGYNSVTISNGYLNGTQATSISPQPAVVDEDYSGFVTFTFKPHTFVDGSQYEIKLISTRGTSTVYNKTFDAAYSTQHNYDEPLPTRLPTRAQIETENRISLTIIASIIIAFVVSSGLFVYLKFIHKRKRVYKTQEQTVYIDRIGQALSSLCIGFGFVFFCFSILLGLMNIVSLIISITP